ncbi:hypothetical protein NPIL_36451 [Nephila pilipes]|uniref:Secreted protein n=1 Tax=Nephila pilipes TaxID=299642 RepID=A0A8X6QAW7_NEPPI|nr:hypothetical protein NPIL_36451 [Nephila pilipes]
MWSSVIVPLNIITTLWIFLPLLQQSPAIGHHWIGRGSTAHWFVGSPEISGPDFFCWVHMKLLAIETHVESFEDTRLTVAAGRTQTIQEFYSYYFAYLKNSYGKVCSSTCGRKLSLHNFCSKCIFLPM